MADAFLRQGVLDHLHLDARAADDPGGAGAADAGVVLCERRFIGKINLRGRPTQRFRAAVKSALGVEPPVAPNTATGAGDVTVLWLGPDEWLAVTAPGAETKTAHALERALGALHCAVTAVGEGRAVIGLSGRNALDVLMKGCPLDVHPRVFAPGRCAQSTYAKALILLHQTGDEPAYDIYVERSFADYLWTWLEDAAQEYGLAVVKG